MRSFSAVGVTALSLAGLLLTALPAEARNFKVADDPAKGEATAPLVLVEFADYQ